MIDMENHLERETPLAARLKGVRKPIVLYGMGNGAEKILRALSKENITVAGIFASDEFVRGQSFAGFEVTTYADARRRFGDMAVLVAFGTARPDVMGNILTISGEQELYAPDVEVAGDALFTEALYREMRAGLAAVYEMLADDASRNVFSRILCYKLSGKIGYLLECETDENEAFTNILKLSNREVYVDAGAYDGDSVRAFAGHAGGYRHIYAIEPDRRNFRKLTASLATMRDVTLVHAVAGGSDGITGFAQSAGRQSAVKGGLDDTIDSCKIGTLAPDATFIKIDVEGHEAEVLRGARQVIGKNRPKILLSAYHRHSDLLLPLDVLKIEKDYRLFMRHHPYIPAWDTNYYFV